MATFLLDVVLEEAQFASSLLGLARPIWLLFRADGFLKQITTPQIAPVNTARFQFPFRLVLALPYLDNHHLKTSLCTFGAASRQVEVLANAQIRLTSVALSNGQPFTYSLLSIAHPATALALVSARATVAALDPAPAGPCACLLPPPRV
jgi:hypothetical protein